MTFQVIIPARFASSRFPGKPLAKLHGREMILHVCDRASLFTPNVAVATDDSRIFETVRRAGFQALMTSDRHRSGTDRVMEAYDKLPGHADVVINVQGDEPFIDPEDIRRLADCFLADDSCQIATLAREIPADAGYEAVADPNLVKVVTSDGGRALYFSRSPIPYLRGVDKEEWTRRHPFKAHVGIYAYRGDVLRDITRLAPSALEVAESLEQLRWLQNGIPVQVAMTDNVTVGIDTPDDLRRAESLFPGH